MAFYTSPAEVFSSGVDKGLVANEGSREIQRVNIQFQRHHGRQYFNYDRRQNTYSCTYRPVNKFHLPDCLKLVKSGKQRPPLVIFKPTTSKVYSSALGGIMAHGINDVNGLAPTVCQSNAPKFDTSHIRDQHYIW